MWQPACTWLGMQVTIGVPATGWGRGASKEVVIYFSPMTANSGRNWHALAAPQSGGFFRL